MSFLDFSMQVSRRCQGDSRDKQKYEESADRVHVCDHDQILSNTGVVNEDLREKKKSVCISE